MRQHENKAGKQMKSGMGAWVCIALFALLGGSGIEAVMHSGGCASTPTSAPDPKPLVSDVANTTKAVGTDVSSRADNIDHDSQQIGQKVTVADQKLIYPFITDTGTQTAGLRQDVGQLATTQTQLSQVNDQVTQLQGSNASQAKQIVTLTAANQSGVKHLMYLLITLAVIGLGVAGALVYSGNLTVSIPLAVGCAGTLVTAIIVAQYAVWLAIAGGVCVLAGIGYLVYQRYTASKAAAETIATAEAAKMAMSVSARRLVFGNGPLPGVADQLQSPTTQAMVKRVRSGTDRLAPLLPPVSLVEEPKAA